MVHTDDSFSMHTQMHTHTILIDVSFDEEQKESCNAEHTHNQQHMENND